MDLVSYQVYLMRYDFIFHYHFKIKIRLYITRTYKHKDFERGDLCKNRSSYLTLFLSEKVSWGGPFDEATKPRSV